MKEALRAAGGLLTAAVAVVVIIAVALNGCGEETEEDNTGGMLGDLKVPEAVPAAPSMGPGIPSVTAVGFYRNWQLTREVEGSVSIGDTVWIKVVFSEPMKLVVSDEKDARPILYRKRSGEGEALVRFRMAAHGSGGEDFVSGDAKPLQNGTDDYICKYTVVPEDEGKNIAFMVGKFSVDTDGNPLAAFYRYPTKLQVGETEPETPEDTTAPTVVSVTHYHSGTPLEAGDTVVEGSVVRTEVLFSEPMEVLPRRGHTARPMLSYAMDGTKERFSVSLSRNISFGYCRPSKNNTLFTCKVRVTGDYTVTIGTDSADTAGNTLAEAGVAPTLTVVPRPVDPDPVVEDIVPVAPIPARIGPTISAADFVGRVYVPKPVRHGLSRAEASPIADVAVTIVSGPRSRERVMTDQNGQYIFPNVEADELHLLVEKEHFEPKAVIVHRSRPTTLPNRITLNFHGDPQKNPGNILIGHAWAKEVRFILQQTLVVNDLLYIDGGIPPNRDMGGFYSVGVVVVYEENVAGFHGKAGVLGTVVHEIAHAHQHALISVDGSGNIWAWKDTPEGKAFAEAQKKDWAEVGRAPYDAVPGYDTLDENAAETAAHYWSVDRWGGRTAYGNLRTEAPNRFKWAQQWLSR